MELKRKLTNHCALFANDSDNTDTDPRKTVFTSKETKCFALSSLYQKKTTKNYQKH